MKEVIVDVPADAAPLVADLDGDVVLSLGDEHVDVRHAEGLAPPVLHGGAHRVLEDLEQDVAQVHGRVHDLDRAVGLHRVDLENNTGIRSPSRRPTKYLYVVQRLLSPTLTSCMLTSGKTW